MNLILLILKKLLPTKRDHHNLWSLIYKMGGEKLPFCETISEQDPIRDYMHSKGYHRQITTDLQLDDEKTVAELIEQSITQRVYNLLPQGFCENLGFVIVSYFKKQNSNFTLSSFDDLHPICHLGNNGKGQWMCVLETTDGLYEITEQDGKREMIALDLETLQEEVTTTKENLTYPRETGELFDTYHENITFVSPDDLDIDPSKLVEASAEFQEQLNIYSFVDARLALKEDKKEIFNLIAQGLEKIGYITSYLETLPAKQLLLVAKDLCVQMIGFTDLTTEEEEKTPLLKFLRQGKGDCDKYASLYRLCRTYFQELFPERVDIQNIYIGNKRYGGDKRKGHARNSIIYFTQDQVVVSHIDPTFADTMDGEYQAADSYHLSAYPELRLARFYRASGDKVAANYFYDLTERNYELDEETKRRISSER